MRSLIRFHKLVALFLIITSGPSLLASDIGAVLSQTYREQIRSLFERYFPAKEFEVVVRVTPKNNNLLDTPYSPKSLTTDSIGRLPVEQLDALVAKVEIELLISNRLRKSKAQLTSLLEKSLRIKPGSRDHLRFSSLGIDVETEDWRKEKQDLLMQSVREKGELKQEISLLKGENENLRAHNERLRGDMEKLRRDFSSPRGDTGSPAASAREVGDLLAHWERGAALLQQSVVGPATRSLLFGIFVLVAAIFGGGYLLSRSLFLIGRSLGGGLHAMAEASSSNNQTVTHSPLPASTGAISVSQHPVSASADFSPEVFNELKGALAGLIDRAEPGVLRRLISAWAPETAGHSIVVMEMIGTQKGGEIFKGLAPKVRNRLLKAYYGGQVRFASPQVRLEAMSALRTALILENVMKAFSGADHRLSAELASLSDNALLRLLEGVSEVNHPGLLMCLTPERVLRLANQVRTTNPIRYKQFIASIGRVHRAKVDPSLEHSIKQTLAMDESSGEETLDWYQDFLEQADPDMSDAVFSQVSQDSRMAALLQSRLLSFHTFLNLPTSGQLMVLEPLSQSVAAAILYRMPDLSRATLLKRISTHRQAILNEEIGHLADLPAEEVDARFQSARKILVSRLHELAKAGRLVGGPEEMRRMAA